MGVRASGGRQRARHPHLGDSDAIREKIDALETEDDQAAAAVVGILKGIIHRDQASAELPELQLSSERIEISDGACKDAEVYIAHGDVLDENLWRSSYKRASAITTKPVVFNGVQLPTGSLFAIQDDGYVFMRLTSYSFEPDKSAVVFGPQEAENRAHTNLDVVRAHLN